MLTKPIYEVAKLWVGDPNQCSGTWVELTMLDGDVVAQICTHSHLPFGILQNIVYTIDNKCFAIINTSIGGVWTTDVIERDNLEQYTINAILYVKNGKLSTRENPAYGVIVGYVVRPPTKANQTIDFLKLG